jgi:hypothetical protein
MNLHKNAKTCPKSRALMVTRVLEEGRSVVAVRETRSELKPLRYNAHLPEPSPPEIPR